MPMQAKFSSFSTKEIFTSLKHSKSTYLQNTNSLSMTWLKCFTPIFMNHMSGRSGRSMSFGVSSLEVELPELVDSSTSKSQIVVMSVHFGARCFVVLEDIFEVEVGESWVFEFRNIKVEEWRLNDGWLLLSIPFNRLRRETI